jgi:rubrerythrin
MSEKIDKALTQYTDALIDGKQPNPEDYAEGLSPKAKSEFFELAEMARLMHKYRKKIVPNKKIPGIGKCPTCKTELCMDDENLHFCPTCGQALQT